jgi:hypothetical protein
MRQLSRPCSLAFCAQVRPPATLIRAAMLPRTWAADRADGGARDARATEPESASAAPDAHVGEPRLFFLDAAGRVPSAAPYTLSPGPGANCRPPFGVRADGSWLLCAPTCPFLSIVVFQQCHLCKVTLFSRQRPVEMAGDCCGRERPPSSRDRRGDRPHRRGRTRRARPRARRVRRPAGRSDRRQSLRPAHRQGIVCPGREGRRLAQWPGSGGEARRPVPGCELAARNRRSPRCPRRPLGFGLRPPGCAHRAACRRAGSTPHPHPARAGSLRPAAGVQFGVACSSGQVT